MIPSKVYVTCPSRLTQDRLNRADAIERLSTIVFDRPFSNKRHSHFVKLRPFLRERPFWSTFDMTLCDKSMSFFLTKDRPF